MSSRAVASSSMTRTQSAMGEWRPSESVELLACASALPGRRTVNTEPLPGSLVTVTSPPIMRASLRVMAKPRPVPPYCRAVEESTFPRPWQRWWKGPHVRLRPRRPEEMHGRCALLDGYHRAVRFWSRNDPDATLPVYVPFEAKEALHLSDLF